MSTWLRSLRRPSRAAALLLLVLIAVYRSWTWSAQIPAIWNTIAGDHGSCPRLLHAPADPPASINLWASLTADEVMDIHDWLFHPSRDLNLTAGAKASLSDNVVFQIEAYRPSKSAALRYLSSPSTNDPPPRYARVTIHRGARETESGGPVIMDYLVGPLPLRPDSEEVTLRPLTEIYHRDDVPFNARSSISPSELAPFLSRIMAPMSSVTQARTFLNDRNDTLLAAGSGPLSFDGSFRRTWISWRRKVAGSWLHPVGFYVYIDCSGTDENQWKVLKLVYNHQIFSTVEDFLQAYHNKTLVRLRIENNTDTSWSSRHRPKHSYSRGLDYVPGPRQVSSSGLRFNVDEELQYLSPQEAISQYAGNDPMQASTAWLDRSFGMGLSVRGLLPGYDCPYEAVYLPAVMHTATAVIRRERAICIFEQDTGRPITRHTGPIDGEHGAVRGYVLTIRTISTVANYDYREYSQFAASTMYFTPTVQSKFVCRHRDIFKEHTGSPHKPTTAHASVNKAVGRHSNPALLDLADAAYPLVGSLHDHVINFKVDLDVAGTANSLRYTRTVQEELTQPWFDDDWGQTVVQQKLVHQYIDNENDALLRYPTNLRGEYAFVNQDKTNSWGVVRGYAIRPGQSPIYNTVVGSKRLLKNANWARYNLAVSLRKDTEPSSSSVWNLNLPGNPMVDFHKFFDGENITQQDLVAWINVGMHHIPQAEDSPNTRTNVAFSSFFLTPLNYFDADVSIDSANAVLLSSSPNYTAEEYGTVQPACMPDRPQRYEHLGLKGHPLEDWEPDEVEDIGRNVVEPQSGHGGELKRARSAG
ncbi:hypothetical protein NM688_g3086 [Phlebia brevispora]|uniref:Uncharacterized protein n=1 Tax=Phlebia brevispora TaxID=194682 RepID=A0ACC1T757_9APHY|nr:hypothetical protein NM688_g3086 [Phlebia brevispora]